MLPERRYHTTRARNKRSRLVAAHAACQLPTREVELWGYGTPCLLTFAKNRRKSADVGNHRFCALITKSFDWLVLIPLTAGVL